MTDTDTTPAVATTGELAAWHASTGFPAVCTPTGLALPDDLTFDEWRQLGGPILGAARASMWWVGDWIRHGHHAYGSKYTEALELTGLAYQTLRHAVMVCDALPVFMRRNSLSWTHHQVVVQGAPRDTWVAWLDRAEAEGLSSDELRAAIRDSKAVPAGSSAGRAKVSRIAIAEAHAPAALRLLSRCDRAWRSTVLTPDEVLALDELLAALTLAAGKAAA